MSRWIKCSDQLPTKEKDYLVWNKPNEFEVGFAGHLKWCDGWNCRREYDTGKIDREFEIKSIVAWQEIEPFEDGEIDG